MALVELRSGSLRIEEEEDKTCWVKFKLLISLEGDQ